MYDIFLRNLVAGLVFLQYEKFARYLAYPSDNVLRQLIMRLFINSFVKKSEDYFKQRTGSIPLEG